jgi:hypothetical protein
MPLEQLDIDATSVSDLGPLAGMSLHYLRLGSYQRDFRLLTGMPLEYLGMSGSGSPSDLSLLAGLPLRTLEGTGIPKDLTPLLRIPTLERLATHVPLSMLAPLRQHPKLAFINYRDKGYRPAVEVWAELDAQKAAGK